MRRTREGNEAPPKHDQRRERPHRAAKSRPDPFGSGVTPASFCWESQIVFWPRRRRERSNLYDNTYDKTNEEERNQNMAIIKAPPKQAKAVTIQARVEEAVKTQLDQYAKFIESTPSYVMTQALKVLFKRDDEFKAWLGQQSNNGNDRGLEGGALKVTA